MDNIEILRSFIKKHNFNPEVDVMMMNGNTWDDVYSVVFNEEDLPDYQTAIPIGDIQFDVISDLPIDAFAQWVNYIKANNYKEYSEWLSENGYNVHIDPDEDMKRYLKSISDSLNMTFNDFTNRNSKVFDGIEYEEKSEGN